MDEKELDFVIEKKKIEDIIANYKPTYYTPPEKRAPKKSIEQEVLEKIQEKGVPMTEKSIQSAIQKYYEEKTPALTREARASLSMIQTEPALAEEANMPSKPEMLDEELAEHEDSLSGILHSVHGSLFKAEMGNEHLSLKEKSEIEAQRLSRKWGMSIVEARNMVKEYVFAMKKEEEVNAKLAEEREKKIKMKHMRQTLKNLKQNEFRIEEDEYDHIKNLINKKFKNQYLGMVKATGMDYNPEQDTYTEKKFKLYKLQSQIRLQEYVEHHFYGNNDYLLNVLQGNNISIEKTILNSGISVMDIFWSYDITPTSPNLKPVTRFSQEEMSERLNRYAKRKVEFIMMREMGLKKPVELRFSPSRKLEMATNMEEGFKEEVVDIAKEILTDKLIKKGIDPEKLTPAMIHKSVMKLESKFLDVVEDRIDYGSMKLKYIADREKKDQKGPKYDKTGKRLRDNKNPDGSKKKYTRSNSANKFWDELKNN